MEIEGGTRVSEGGRVLYLSIVRVAIYAARQRERDREREGEVTVNGGGRDAKRRDSRGAVHH